MATESERECGYRQVHGIYLMSGVWTFSHCDRHEQIPACPCCATQPKFTQGIYKVEYKKLFKKHENCMCRSNCPICYPKDHLDYYIDWVGNSFYTEESFKKEAREKGISRQAQWTSIPESFDLKKAYIICAMKSVGEEIKGTKLNPNAKTPKTDMIILGYKPERIEYLINESEKDLTEWKDKPEDFEGTYYEWIISVGVTPIVIPDDDPDHHKRVKKIKGLVPAAKRPKAKKDKKETKTETETPERPFLHPVLKEDQPKPETKKSKLEKYVNRLKNQKTAKEIVDQEPDREINVDQETGEISETIDIEEKFDTPNLDKLAKDQPVEEQKLFQGIKEKLKSSTQEWVEEQKENIAKYGDKALDEHNKKEIKKAEKIVEKKFPEAFNYLNKKYKTGDKEKTTPVIKDDNDDLEIEDDSYDRDAREVNLFDNLTDEDKEIVINLGLDGQALQESDNNVVQANKWLLEYFEKQKKQKKQKIETIDLDDSYEVFYGSQ